MLNYVAYLILFGLFLLAIFTMVQVLFAFLYLYIEAKLNPDVYPNVNLFIIIKNYCIELIYVCSRFILFPIQFLPLIINPNNNAKKIIILVHGYMRTKTDWLPLLNNLRNKNTDPILSVNLSCVANLSIQQLAASLQQKINKLSKNYPNLETITLVGHSMGGLVCAYYAEYLAEKELVDTIITLGTPFYGTKAAAVGVAQSSKQMLPNAKFLLILREKVAKSSINYINIASNLDNLIFPWTSTLLESSKQSLVLNNISHLSLISSKQTANIIKNICIITGVNTR